MLARRDAYGCWCSFRGRVGLGFEVGVWSIKLSEPRASEPLPKPICHDEQVLAQSDFNLGSCQNYGPFLGILNNRCRIVNREPDRDRNFDNHPL